MLSSALCGSIVHAHQEKMAVISGQQIRLDTTNHSFAGFIKNRMVAGFKKKGTFESELTVIDGDRKTISTFKKNGPKPFSGSLQVLNGDEISQHSIEFISLNRDENTFLFHFDGETAEVRVYADKFERGHYINPEYYLEYKGEQISFKLEGGEACYGYSMHLIAMIFPAYIF